MPVADVPTIMFCNVEIHNHKTKYITIITNNSDQAKAKFVLSFANKNVL